MSRGTAVTLALGAAFAGLLLYSTLSAQKHECTVTVEYEGRTNTASASADSDAEAAKQAQTAACGPIAPGMNGSIACGNRVPVKKDCRTL